MISVLYNIILITNFKLIEMCIKSSPHREGSKHRVIPALTYAVTLFLFLVPPHLAITIFELQPTDENAVRIIQN